MSQIPKTKIAKGWRVTIPLEYRGGLKIGDLVTFDKDCIKKLKIVKDKEGHSSPD